MKLTATLTAIAAALALGGCVTVSAAPDWNVPPPANFVAAGKAKLVLVVDMPLEDIPQYCGRYESGVALACANQSLDTGIWVIYTSTRAEWVMTHEYAHAGGWNHD